MNPDKFRASTEKAAYDLFYHELNLALGNGHDREALAELEQVQDVPGVRRMRPYRLGNLAAITVGDQFPDFDLNVRFQNYWSSKKGTTPYIDWLSERERIDSTATKWGIYLPELALKRRRQKYFSQLAINSLGGIDNAQQIVQEQLEKTSGPFSNDRCAAPHEVGLVTADDNIGPGMGTGFVIFSYLLYEMSQTESRSPKRLSPDRVPTRSTNGVEPLLVISRGTAQGLFEKARHEILNNRDRRS